MAVCIRGWSRWWTVCSEDIDVSEYYDHKPVDHDQLRSAHVGGYCTALLITCFNAILSIEITISTLLNLCTVKVKAC